MLILLLFVVNTQAQDNGYVYKDSSILYADSVDTKLVETENQNDFEEYDDNAGEIYQDTSLRSNQLSLEKDSVEALKRLKAFAYAKNLDSLLYQYQKGKKAKQSAAKNKVSWVDSFFASSAIEYFFWALGILFILFILYNLFFTEGFFQRSYTKSKVTETTDESEKLSSVTDFSKLISMALASKNYRLAIRYQYLQLLQKMSLKGIIEFTPDKTNHEYVTELAGKSYKKDFAAITLQYEYAWYGEFEIDEHTYEKVQQEFKKLNNIL